MHTYHILHPLEIIFGVKNGHHTHCNLLYYELILILEDNEIHIHTQLWGSWRLGKGAICILLGKDKKTPFVNLRSQVKNMLVRSS